MAMNTCLTTWGRRLAAACLLLSLLACASAPQVSLPLRFAWFEGRQVGYVSTDASDADDAIAAAPEPVPAAAPAPTTHHLGGTEVSDFFIGQVMMTGFNFAPKFWAQCNGQLLPISQNQALFSLLGTQFGGNGTLGHGFRVCPSAGLGQRPQGLKLAGSNRPFRGGVGAQVGCLGADTPWDG